MSNKELSEKKGFILYKLGRKTLKELLDELPPKGEEGQDVSVLVKAAIEEIPYYRAGADASVEDLNAFVKYIAIMRDYIEDMETKDE